ncbi:MAG: HAD-IIIA family hydrolase [Verrucomicrobia bacterium]|jgi:D,D-heptose 1,7-bisphosphate phosphatase|nr:HAD-IIIA family hydrolase [Verrucomicrobiota bacterium]
MTGQAVIVAGGSGTRLRARLGDLPKPMILIGGKPLLEHQIELARSHGFTDIIILACYRADLIKRYIGDGSRFGVSVSTIVEREPLGTAGALLAAMDQLAENFVVLYGDTMVNIDLQRIWERHRQSRADATLLVHPNDHPLDSDLLETSAGGWIEAFHNRPHATDHWFQNLVNAGLYVIRKAALEPWAGGSRAPLDFGKDLFPALLNRGSRLLAYNSPEFIKDIGTPERYDRICAEYQTGVVARSSLRTPQRAVFLDRDGTLISDKDCLRRAEDLELLPGVANAVRQLNHHGWRAVLATNQPVVAKGWCSEAELQRIHNKLETLLGREHAFLDRIYFCPHHPESGFAGERAELKICCQCRKPAPGMLIQAAADLNLDLAQSWLIGDSTSDIQAAVNGGVRSVLVRTGCAGRDGRYPVAPHFVFDTLGQTVDFIIQNAEPSAQHS